MRSDGEPFPPFSETTWGQQLAALDAAGLLDEKQRAELLRLGRGIYQRVKERQADQRDGDDGSRGVGLPA